MAMMRVTIGGALPKSTFQPAPMQWVQLKQLHSKPATHPPQPGATWVHSKVLRAQAGPNT